MDDELLATPSEPDPVIDYDKINQNIDSILGNYFSQEEDTEVSDDVIRPEPAFDDVTTDQILVADPDLGMAELSDQMLRSSSEYPDNMIVYEGVFNGSTALLYLPAQYVDDVSIINGYLYNVSNNSFYGRLNSLVMTDYEISTYTLSPCIGNPNTVYRNGYYNYKTEYYESSSYESLRTTVTYGDFYVTDILSQQSSASPDKLHFDMLVMILLMGVLVLCSWKKLRS